MARRITMIWAIAAACAMAFATAAAASRPCGTITTQHAFGSSAPVTYYRTRVKRGHTSCHEARRVLRWWVEYKVPIPPPEPPGIVSDGVQVAFEGWSCGGRPGVKVGTGPYTCLRQHSPGAPYLEEIEALP